MSKNFKKTIAFIFFLLAGIVLGAFVAYICRDVKFLSWLSWGQKVGIPTTQIDLLILKLNFGLTFDVTIAQIFTVPLALVIFNKTCKSM